MSQNITPEVFLDYAERYSSPQPEALKALYDETQGLSGAQMISGHVQGLFLKMISLMLRPKKVLEIGTFTGYSAICLAAGLQEGGQVQTIDNDLRLNELRVNAWQQNGCAGKIQFLGGDAAEIIPNLEADFELVFIDADKKNYALYFDLLIDRLPPGAFIVADNTLFHGEVVLPPSERGKAASYIHQFNEKIAAESRVEQVLLPLRDGLTILRKLI